MNESVNPESYQQSGKVLTGSRDGDAVPDLEIPRYIRLMEAGKMPLDGIITYEFGLDEINEALDLFRSRKVGRVMMNMRWVYMLLKMNTLSTYF